MGRWQPNSRGRLEQAALELYVERGFAQTTVTEIARQAGLTERTFFRYFADKREVLFSGSAQLQEVLVSAVAGAPEQAAPIDAVAAGLDAIGGVLRDLPRSRRRQSVISANPELQERELAKLATLSTAVADTLRGRGVQEPAATLAADAGIAVFRVSFERWIDGPEDGELRRFLKESLAELKAVTSAS
ncbi:TetR family transcriptional regulator [Actinacidiphila bryophytorum]|uniref:TetR family transcriptional regulator n=1 Tax=Actinacidiphila bryophytorum TaxID=1436133 RepID=UPI002176CF89|nr:TetR family transcriptional regulator [Actinacidiphila bryophytorum]UWE09873.1 TetR family transcriptional regulator [Actinacidiphila bryophytorum]